MKLRWLVLAILLIVLPTALYARWIKDKVVFEVEATGEVAFSHYDHLEVLGKNCTTCHNDVFHIVREKNPDFTMAQMEKGKACGACHNGQRAFDVSDDCSICHPTREITFDVAAAGPTVFSHDIHTAMFGCSECHPGIFVPNSAKNPDYTMAQMAEGEACGACHDGSMAFSVEEDCSTCHPTREITFDVAAAGPTVFSHDIHTTMFGCSECHPGIFVPNSAKNPDYTMAQMAEGEACGACHDGSMAFSVEEDCSSCHPTREITFKVPDIGNVTFSHDIHTAMFGCSECHPGIFVPNTQKNPDFTMDQMAEGEACGACHDGSMAFSVEDACDVCHAM